MAQRKVIEAQIAELLHKAAQPSCLADQMGMVGFASVLLAGQMHILLAMADMEESGNKKKHEEKNGIAD